MIVVGFNTKQGPTTVSLRALVNGNPRLFTMNRYKFMNLFPNQQLSSNLRELTMCLPIVGVGFLDGLEISMFNICENMAEAEEDILRLSAVPAIEPLDDSSFDPLPGDKAKKRLSFEHTSTKTTAGSSNQHHTTPATPSHSRDEHSTSPKDPDNVFIPNRDILNLQPDTDDETSHPQPKDSKHTSPNSAHEPQPSTSHQNEGDANFPLNHNDATPTNLSKDNNILPTEADVHASSPPANSTDGTDSDSPDDSSPDDSTDDNNSDQDTAQED